MRAGWVVACGVSCATVDLCAPLRLPLAPAGLAVALDGDLLSGVGSDVLRYHPPGP